MRGTHEYSLGGGIDVVFDRGKLGAHMTKITI